MKFLKSRIVQFILVIALLGGIGAAILYMQQEEVAPKITEVVKPVSEKLDGLIDFQYERDHEYINSVFDDDQNWYWLVEGDRSDFSPEYMMRTLSRAADPTSKGKLLFKVLYKTGKPIGFLIYYMKNFYQGNIWFVFVDKQQRGKGYGRQLVQHAIEDLTARGAAQIKLVTRVENKASRTIYERLNFKPGYITPNNLIYYSKDIG